MKKSILFFLLIIFSFSCFTNPCEAQFNTYHLFPHTNARWGQWFKLSVNWYYYHYFVNGDTTVNSKSYFKVYKSSPIYNGLYRLLREDTVNEIIYESKDWGLTEDTLYDFNLNVGDTLPAWKNNSNKSLKEYVKKVDSILIGKSYRRMLVVTNIADSAMQSDSLIEGIGSSHGLLESYVWGVGEERNLLICFEENDTTVYPYLNYNCSVPLAVPTIEEPYKATSVFPNPNKGIFTITFSHSELVSASQPIVEIYNVLGQKVMGEILRSAQDDNLINLTNQPDGVYFYRVLKEDFSVIGEGKVVIQK